MLKSILSKIAIFSFLLTTFAPAAVLAQTTDTSSPVIRRLGPATVNIVIGQKYLDRGAIAWDSVDGNITNKIVTVNPVSTSTLGTYTVTYNVSDLAGNAALQVIRTVNVVATSTPSPTATSSPVHRIKVTGEITAISSTSLVILTKKDRSQIVDLATSTAIVKRGKPITLAGLKIGDKIKVTGILQTTGHLTAIKVKVVAKKEHPPARGFSEERGNNEKNQGHSTQGDNDDKEQDDD